MKKTIFLIIKLTLFWLLLFALQHTIFLIYNYHELKDIPPGLILSSYYFALGMDISASAYLLVFPGFLLIATLFIKKNNILIKSIHIINILLIIICIIIGISDTGLYSVWGTKINSKALSYLAYPKEAIISFAAVPYWILISIMIIEGAVLIFIYKRIFRPGYLAPIKFIYKIIFSIVLLFSIFTAMRGGWQKYPINKSWVYFSKYPVLNYSALNGFWNFMEIIVKPGIKENPYRYFTKAKADSIVNAMQTASNDSTEMILTTTRPNIVLIMMESVSAECVESLGGIPGIMPGIDSLIKNGLNFNNFYANGFRTEQGLISLLSNFPAQPQTTIMRNFGKFDKLPNLARILGDKGYSENYYYSGNLVFANQDSYIKLSGFTHILDKDNYTWNRSTDWGAYDEELFACHLKEAEKDPQPFFSIIMTSTNHEPFNADVEKIFKGKSEADDYKNTAHYTDKCLSEYLQKAKTKSWYNNTLFIITADHAHTYPKKRGANEAERHHIPFVLYGNVLKSEYKGKTFEKIGSQIDLPAMLLSQLKIPYKPFEKSKNIFNKYSPGFAFYTFDNGFGIITSQQIIVYDHNLGQVVYRKNKLSPAADEEITNQGKAYLQVLLDEYIGFNN
ncbi:MAG TPA: sulfatase-like hydrolase/transferase [Bacteroidales bacterium]|nr:sulfatase-like hydrolase/transferase [Bacteroidales bacterium]HPS16722.1 sulfatase-like hydrolase/transferase [Bacteroidales bacterium]